VSLTAGALDGNPPLVVAGSGLSALLLAAGRSGWPRLRDLTVGSIPSNKQV